MNETTYNKEVSDTDPCIIAFNLFVYCFPIHKYIIDIISDTISYSCGLENTINLTYSYINHLIPDCKYS